MYSVYINNTKLPVTPAKIETKIKNNNKVVNLINEGDVSILKLPGLTEITFDALIPQVQYPFADKLKSATTYTEQLEKLKVSKKPFQFIVIRTLPNGRPSFNTNIKVSLENYQIIEDVKNGLDLVIKISLKQYREYGTKLLKLSDTPTSEKKQVTIEEKRPAENAPDEKTYTVKSGDCLWNIAKAQLGDGNRYNEIYELNKDKIKTPNLIYPDTVLVLP